MTSKKPPSHPSIAPTFSPHLISYSVLCRDDVSGAATIVAEFACEAAALHRA
jgi:hypothetical protein